MKPQDYKTMSEAELLALCIWREASNQSSDARRGVAHVIKNRASHPSIHWWGTDIPAVIMKPWQFSSFPVFRDGININKDPNCNRWPENEEEPAWVDSIGIASVVLEGTDEDLTAGATFYYDDSIGWPGAWGSQEDYINTVNIGTLHFWKRHIVTNHQAVADVAAGE